MARHEISQVELDDDEVRRILISIIRMTAKDMKTDYGYVAERWALVKALLDGSADPGTATISKVKALIDKLDNWSKSRKWFMMRDTPNGFGFEDFCLACGIEPAHYRDELAEFLNFEVGSLQIRQAVERYFERVESRKLTYALRKKVRRLGYKVREARKGVSRPNAAGTRREDRIRRAEATGAEATPAASADPKDAEKAGLPGGDAEDTDRSGDLF